MRRRKRLQNNKHGGQRQLVEGQQRLHPSRYVFKDAAADVVKRGHRGARFKSSKN